MGKTCRYTNMDFVRADVAQEKYQQSKKCLLKFFFAVGQKKVLQYAIFNVHYSLQLNKQLK